MLHYDTTVSVNLPLVPMPTPEAAVRWLSRHRYEKYLSFASGNHDLAMQVYVWNAELSSAVLRDLAYVEVALRNAYDQQLSVAYPDWATDPNPGWLLLESGTPRAREKQRRVNRQSLPILQKAQRDVGTGATHGQVMARISFGFWQFLSHPARETTLWTPYLHKAFPTTPRRSEVHKLAESTVRLRNRLAHLEPVASTRFDLVSHLEESNRLFALLAPDAHDWIWNQSDVMQIIARVPVSGLISMRRMATGLRS